DQGGLPPLLLESVHPRVETRADRGSDGHRFRRAPSDQILARGVARGAERLVLFIALARRAGRRIPAKPHAASWDGLRSRRSRSNGRASRAALLASAQT